ncbi:MAG: sugar kinase [Chloroflexi bacterium]|nr:sugar kinase [Chloroflexota bacterium]
MSSHSFVTIGEVLLRLTTPRRERLTQARQFDAIYGGTECNVAVALGQFGVNTALVTRIPNNDIGQACVNFIRQYGVDTSKVVRSGDRLGLYFLEIGASMRPSAVVYDRARSAMSEIEPEMIDWPAALAGRDWFHFSGITCAISERATATVAAGCEAAKTAGMTVSTDFNYRSALWSPEEAADRLTPLMKYVDVAIGSARDPILGVMLGESGNIEPDGRTADSYRSFVESAVSKFGFDKVALTVRDVHSSDHNSWQGVYFDGTEIALSRRHEIDIVDRVGGGDGFAAGAIWGVMNGWGSQRTADFAAASGAIAHTVHGDFNLASEAEVLGAALGGADVRR